MKRLVRQFVTMGRVLEFDESLAALRAVADLDIVQLARQYLRRDAFSLLAYGTKGLNGIQSFDFTFTG
jgi:ABC-type iron transport system FetAB ATPase subunit